jgi:hypothetical protein
LACLKTPVLGFLIKSRKATLRAVRLCLRGSEMLLVSTKYLLRGLLTAQRARLKMMLVVVGRCEFDHKKVWSLLMARL